MQKKFVALAVVIVLIAIVAYFYFAVISPVVTKPISQKPTLKAGEPVTTEHVNWVVNELGGYKLHASLSGEPAEIEVVSGSRIFSVTTQDGKTVAKDSKASNPDIRITASAETLVKLFAASDLKSEIAKLYNEGSVGIELLKDQATLALKGYKGLYDELQGK